MTPEDFKRIESLFEQATDLPPDERTSFLRQACPDGPRLVEQVERLLAHADRELALAALSQSIGDHDPTDPDSTLDEPSDRRVGAYQLIRKLGEGGFGVVYEAEQSEPVRRRVALKLIKPGMDSRQVIARFEAEQQALALMEHPSIARVLQAGAIEKNGTERPYFVMELVPGEPITTYCDNHRLTIDQRLRLFTQVCMAVQHAHQKGIIHRDLKPSNVLVTAGDDGPIPKIIDFGIAKAVEEPLTDQTLRTRANQMVGTPEYMSPEQATTGDLDIDTRSDVYSLGVLLYELLTGVTPFSRMSRRVAGEDEIRRLIKEVEPPRPSLNFATRFDSIDDESSKAVSRARGTDSVSLRRRIQGELDWIVMRAIEKERHRRYESASELAADVRRFLNNEPLAAGPPSAVYRVRKFVRRNKATVVAASIVAAVLVVGAFTTTIFAVGQAIALQRADQQARQRDALNTFLIDEMLTAPGIRGIDITLREVLDDASVRVGSAFEDDPQTEAIIRSTLGKAYLQLGEVDDALMHFARALELRLKMLGPEHPETIRSTNELASAYELDGDFDRAMTMFAQALEDSRRIQGADHPDNIAYGCNLAHVHHLLGDFDAAERGYRDALALAEQCDAMEGRDASVTLNNLAALYVEYGMHHQALPIHQRELEISRRINGPEHPDTLASMANLAMAKFDGGNLADAEQDFNDILAIQERVLGPEHHDTLTVRNNLAGVMLNQARYDEALTIFEETLETRRRKLGPDHPNTLDSAGNLASTYMNLQRFDEAEPLLRETLDRRRDRFGNEHPDTLNSLGALATFLDRVGRRDEAEPLAVEAMEMRSRLFGEDHPATLIARNNLSVLYRRLDRPTDALPVIEPAVAAARTALADHPNGAVLISEYGTVLELLGRFDEAEPLFREAIDHVRRTLAGDHWMAATVEGRYGRFLVARGRWHEAEPMLLAAHEVLATARGEDDIRAVRVAEALIELYENTDREVDAARWRAKRPG